MGHAGLAGLHLAHLRHDALAGLTGDQACGDRQRLGMEVLDRLLERGGEAGVHRARRLGQLLQEFLLQLGGPGELLGVAGCDRVLEATLDPFELRLELRAETQLGQVVPPDVVEVSFHAPGDDRAGDDQGDQRERSRGDQGEQLRSERQVHIASVHFQDGCAVQRRAGRHVTDCSGMTEHVRDDRLVVRELGRRQALSGEDPLLPIAPHRRNRA